LSVAAPPDTNLWMIPLARNPQHPDAPAAGAFQDLAEVVQGLFGSVVRLPPQFSRQAVCELLRRVRLPGSVVMGPADISGAGSIAPEQWAIIAPDRHLHLAPERKPLLLPGDAEGKALFVFPKHTLVLPDSQVGWVLSALEAAKPERLDPEGRPLPWVPARSRSPTPELETGREDDVQVSDAETLPQCPQPIGDDEGAVIATSTIRGWFEQICATLRFPAVPLVVKRGREDGRGFVKGRVEMTSSFVPRRIVITTCPNADQAEIAATLVHEIAHPLSRCQDHGSAFRQTLLELAARLWGEPYLAGARAHCADSYALVDRWVTCGVRAALAGREPPTGKVCDDGHAARIVGKIAKLWALASDQLGKPEGIGATALANDLITVYGLEQSQVCTAPSFDDQMIDRWILLEPRQPWQRTVAHEVAHFNGVYSLSMDSKARMHFFGRYSDIVAAEYLCAISIERIKRECAAYVGTLRGSLPRGEARRASVAFCESAVLEFGRKLRRILAQESAHSTKQTEQAVALDDAKGFALKQVEMRGMKVGTGRGREVRFSAVGAEVGRSMQVVRGLDSQGGPPRQLPGRK
jgi:hypothetical protein